MASLLPEIPDPYLASLVFGVLYGLTTCAASCLPYLASYIAGVGAGFRRGFIIALTFSSGRILAYGLLAGFAAIIQGFLTDFYLNSFQRYASIVAGVVIAIVGLNILLRKKSSACNCKKETIGDLRTSSKVSRFFDLSAFSMGFTKSFLVCPPLIAVLLYAMVSFSPLGCIAITLLFGLGTTLSPLLLFSGTIGWIFNKSPAYSKWISKIAGVMLLLLAAQLLLYAATTFSYVDN